MEREEINNEWFDKLFIKPDVRAKKVVKYKKRLTGEVKKQFTLDNKELILDTISKMVEVVRKNHFSKKSYRILRLANPDEKLGPELFGSLDYIMFLKYRSRYQRGYTGWIVEEIPYVPDIQTKTDKELQDEFLAKNKVERVETEINYLSKDLHIYKSKSYISGKIDYNEVLKDIVHIYDNIRYMKPDGSLDILFKFKRNVFSMGKNAYQTFYYLIQTDNRNQKRKEYAMNELSIPSFLEENGFVKYDHKVASKYYSDEQERKYRLSQKPKESKKTQTVINGNKFVVDNDEWSEDWFSNLTGFQG